MTENNCCYRERRQFLVRTIMWSEVLITIILVVFLFPSSQSLYAVPSIYPPQRTADHVKDDSNIHKDPVASGRQNDSIPVVNQEKEKGVTETTEKPEAPDQSKTSDQSEEPVNGATDEDLKQPDGSEPLDSLEPEKMPEQTDGEEVSNAVAFRGNPQAGKKVALTFDDGPYAVWTAEYIKVLEEYQVPAAFFLVGTRVERYQEITRKIAEKGFDLGSHSYRHDKLTLVKPETLEEDFRKTVAALNMSADVNYFRPPYGAYNQSVLETAQRHGLKTICWNVDPRDWETDDSDKVVDRVLSHVTDGSIILLHEGRKSTLEALPKIITGLKEKGYQLVGLAELME
ncbi:MAG: polysaccharide deacetylase family protein [Dehalobacterium sp.]